jgi:hypothetical protein
MPRYHSACFCHLLYPTHLSHFHLIALMQFREVHELLNYMCNSLFPPVTSSNTCPNALPMPHDRSRICYRLFDSNNQLLLNGEGEESSCSSQFNALLTGQWRSVRGSCFN